MPSKPSFPSSSPDLTDNSGELQDDDLEHQPEIEPVRIHLSRILDIFRSQGELSAEQENESHLRLRDLIQQVFTEKSPSGICLLPSDLLRSPEFHELQQIVHSPRFFPRSLKNSQILAIELSFTEKVLRALEGSQAFSVKSENLRDHYQEPANRLDRRILEVLYFGWSDKSVTEATQTAFKIGEIFDRIFDKYQDERPHPSKERSHKTLISQRVRILCDQHYLRRFPSSEDHHYRYALAPDGIRLWKTLLNRKAWRENYVTIQDLKDFKDAKNPENLYKRIVKARQLADPCNPGYRNYLIDWSIQFKNAAIQYHGVDKVKEDIREFSNYIPNYLLSTPVAANRLGKLYGASIIENIDPEYFDSKPLAIHINYNKSFNITATQYRATKKEVEATPITNYGHLAA